MFLEAMLDGTSSLGPTMENGWNIYTPCNKDSKGLTAPDGSRLGLNFRTDRELSDKILPHIPLEKTVFCLLHGLARVVEKFLTLVVEDVLSEGNKFNSDKDGKDYVSTRLFNLETNINLRGVRQGSFRINFDNNGNLKQIKLNKDHALTILSPALKEMPFEVPHVLHNVSDEREVVNNIKPKLKKSLKLKNVYPKYKLLKLIWHNFFEMVQLLRKDPDQTLLPGKSKGL